MPGPDSDTLAGVAQTVAGTAAAARAGGLDDTAALAATREIAAELERSELALIEAARNAGATWTRIAAAMGTSNRQAAQKRHADLTRRPRPPSVDTPAPKVPDTRQDVDIPGAKTLVNAGALPKSTTRPPRRPANASDPRQVSAALARTYALVS
jgi:hypothetical protein